MYSVYKITNIINGKSYIGLSENPNSRFFLHLSNSNSASLKRAVKKYGKSNFSLSILESGIKYKDEGRMIEDFYMYSNHTIYPYGYNTRCNRALLYKKGQQFSEKIRPLLNGIKYPFTTMAKETNIPLSRIRLIFGYSLRLPTEEEQELICKFVDTDFIPIKLLD